VQDDPREIIRRLATLASIPLSEERIAALAPTLLFVQTGLAALADVDYCGVEPAGRFRPRPEAPR
jgi:Asp-tRNA(Asn)/Glu-tRNA(Gln) amidotransferase C subunit